MTQPQPQTKLAARTCKGCGKPRGVFAFARIVNGLRAVEMWHPRCFTRLKAKDSK